MGTCGDETWWTANESLIHDGDFEEVFGQCSRLKVVVVGFTDPSEEAHRTGPAELELQHAEHETFGFEDFVDGVTTVNHVDDFLHRRTVDLLVLSGNEDGCRSDQL